MPLRVKVSAGSGVSRAQMSTKISNDEFKPLPEDEADDVLFNSLYGLRTIELNRPKKLNSLTASMIRKIVPRLHEWEKSDMANIIVMKGAGEKAFCAGGDVTALVNVNKESPDGWKKSASYFGMEYKLDHYIATYKKPYVAFMDGITMGGGVGLTIHAPFRIATERTVFAMPETTIGFFPDVGASFFLPRMNGAVGTYLALTSDRLKGANVFYSGVATHYLHSTSLPAVESRLAELRFRDYDPLEKRLSLIKDTLEEYATGLPQDEPMQISGEVRKAIDRCFSKNSVEDIVAALRAEASSPATQKWAEKTLDTLHKRSPTAVNVTLRQMRLGRGWSIAETFKREHEIAAHFMRHPDFNEGVGALLMSRDNPRAPAWQPATLEDVQDAGAVVDPFFESIEDIEPLELFNEEDYNEYQFPELGVPTEEEIRKVVESGIMSPKEVEKHIVATRNGRQGIAAIVKEVISRKVQTDESGKAVWVEDEEGL
ncbi:3-hydroxyisobutyryl-CoA hydrolase [Sodiomyces alkalinus F11]|uniref:3-hydroxyisobutyryl-CoA hydrolase n=1 Tax=Sodiomyces alkalinus (strain CBS 110278 / VKM F-3762 / F11) TaxID=1314773 RepID=A0A3N2PJ41_SODAK|nr:3-hydroxyisobutyryl-CoA hydrolase [Sodiomyces alkalinus F11]ROT34558.1 3-hydroxyisobutyryl-CoA hydrolase [Sodiomyces alkalinus F11]